ncbi:MAG TPA: hypothetical protein VGD65_10390 [Chryseosolibacter sp.]
MKTVLVALTLFAHLCFAQTESTFLVLTNRKASVLIDGELKGDSQPNIPFKVVTMAGEHYVQVQYQENDQTFDKAEIVVGEPGKQRIIKLLFDEKVSEYVPPEIKVSDLNFSIPGILNVSGWKNNNPGQDYPYPTHYLAFEKGDVIVLNTSMTNKNGTNSIEVATYPDGVLKYTNNKFTELVNLEIPVEQRSIYRFTFATNHTFDRNCFLKVSRKPASREAETFNSNVVYKRVFTPVSVLEPTAHWVHSGSNAFFSGGKSRIVVPVKLPENTVEWFYRFSSSRSQADIENVRQNFQLFGELSKLLLTASGFGLAANKAVDIGVDQLAIPPGANICDVYLLTYDDIQNFEAKNDGNWRYVLDGSRSNLMSGNVKVTCCTTEQMYLGIRNPAPMDGINVSIEVIAITAKDEYVMVSQ